MKRFTSKVARRIGANYRPILMIAAFVGLAFVGFMRAVAVNSGVGGNAAGRVLWQADHETGDLTQWFLPSRQPDGRHGGGIYDSGLAEVVAAHGISHSGAAAAKLSILTPGGVSSGVRLCRWEECHAYPRLRSRAWYYFPQLYTVRDWWNIFQWISKTPSRNDPFFIVNVGNRPDGAMYLYLWDWQKHRTFQQSVMNVPVGQWFQIEAEYRCDPKMGSLTVWQDKQLLFSMHNIPTRYKDGDCQWSVNDYSNGVRPEPAVIYVDDAAIMLP